MQLSRVPEAGDKAGDVTINMCIGIEFTLPLKLLIAFQNTCKRV